MRPAATCSAAGPGTRWASFSEPSEPTWRVRWPSAVFDQRSTSRAA
nr:hypothetical protein [Pseudonocardia sp. ICBG1142]